MREVIFVLVLVAVVGVVVSGEELEARPKACSFPFTYMGQKYDGCTEDNGARPWCSLTQVYNGSWIYCAKVTGDLVTNDHFLRLLEEAKKVEVRLKELLNAKNTKAESCANCMSELKKVTEWIKIQSNVFMDQNKRIQGLSRKLEQLLKLRADIQSYRMRRYCRQTTKGGDYLGQVSTTHTGKTCQAWSSQRPHTHGMTLANQYPDNDVRRAKNFCRNPDQSAGPWCYTTDSKLRHEGCYIPICNVDCKISDDKSKASLQWCDALPTKLTCKSGYTLYQGKCYRAEPSTKASFSQAEKNCESQGGALASIGNYEISRFLATLFPKNTANHYWIGLTDEILKGDYKWTDGAKFNVKYWGSGEPNHHAGNEHCVMLNWNRAMPWAWNDFNCKSSEHYICEMKPSGSK